FGFRHILKENWKFLVILLLGVVILWFNTMGGNFVSDDYATIPQNPLIMSFKHGLNGWMGGLINWFLAVTFGIGSSIPYHITSLLIYLAVLLVVFVLINVILENSLIAKMSVIIFAVFPIHVEAVTWIAGRPYLLNALFVILSLIAFVLYSKTENKKYFWWFLVLAFLTFVAEKTRSTALPLLGVLYWISFDHKLKKKLNLGKILLLFAGLFLIVIIVLWPQMMDRIQTVNSGTNVSDSIFYDPLFQYPTAIPKYLQLIWAPTDLTLYHTMYVIPTWLNWSILLIYLTALIWFFVKDKRIFFALAFIFASTAPSMAPVKISWLVAERYMFLGSLGMAIVLALFLEKIYQKQKIISLILLTILVSFYGTRVFLRNIDWQTNHNLWVNTCQVSPNSHNAWNNIGDDYDKLKQYDNAIKGFGQSTFVKQNYADAYHNQANIFYKIGRLDLASLTYEKGLSYNPYLYQSYMSLVQIDLTENNIDSLTNHLNKMQQIKPNDPQVIYISAAAYAKVGKIEEAKKLADVLYKQFPNIKEVKDLYDSLNTEHKN
ncbi:MAG: tetratricopeptide repeat protein, partial [Candidatus Shapirobacteria bacterium]